MAEGDDGGGLLVIEVDDLLLDAASGHLHLPLFILANDDDVEARLQLLVLLLCLDLLL
jgi:hypothetical protein